MQFLFRGFGSHEVNTDPCGTIYDLHVAYRESKLSPEAVFRGAVTKARKALEDKTGEWISVASDADVDAQLRALKNLEANIPLWGIPFAVKDNIDVEGYPTTAACTLEQFQKKKKSSAVAVQKLKEAGALFVGKTNLDQFATGLVGTRSPYGKPTSAWDDTLVSGGSSSGSGTVVARGVVPFSLGTDTAGSGRVPAAFNGIVGLKPSLGRVSNVGVYPACESLDCVSIFALTASDAAVVLNVIESIGEEGDVRYAKPKSGPKTFPKKEELRIAIPSMNLPEITSDVSPEDFTQRFQATVDTWRDRAEIVPFDMKVLNLIAIKLYGGPWVAERYSSFKTIMQDHSQAVDETVFHIMKKGPEVTGVETFENMHDVQSLRSQASKIWEKVDVIMVPSTPHHPTTEQADGDDVDMRVRVNAELGSYTNFVNFLGWSALAVPVHSEHSTPFGITWIAPAGHESALIELACRYSNLESNVVGAPNYEMKASQEALSLPTGTCDALSIFPDEPTMPLAVVGAHLAGMPLHSEVINARGKLKAATKTAKSYRLFRLNQTPPKPALVRVSENDPSASQIEIEVYEVPLSQVGAFLSGIPHPLGLGKIQCSDETWVTGFIAEPVAVEGAEEITQFGGWRKYLEGDSS